MALVVKRILGGLGNNLRNQMGGVFRKPSKNETLTFLVIGTLILIIACISIHIMPRIYAAMNGV